jgi:hypothetical protein
VRNNKSIAGIPGTGAAHFEGPLGYASSASVSWVSLDYVSFGSNTTAQPKKPSHVLGFFVCGSGDEGDRFGVSNDCLARAFYLGARVFLVTESDRLASWCANGASAKLGRARNENRQESHAFFDLAPPMPVAVWWSPRKGRQA